VLLAVLSDYMVDVDWLLTGKLFMLQVRLFIFIFMIPDFQVKYKALLKGSRAKVVSDAMINSL
jgi:hypothetical protein